MKKRSLPVYPFVAIVGQEEMKLGLLLNAVDDRIGGLLILGHRGTGKSTAVRGLAEILPEIPVVAGCSFRCDPAARHADCPSCSARTFETRTEFEPVAVIDLPLGATEDRVVGSIDLEAALIRGKKSFEPGLLAAAHRGFLYIDEVNLLEDHLVDLLLDVAAGGENVVERESISVRHPSRFVLIGTGNPEEGELRPQLLDRFGLATEVRTESDPALRTEIVRRRLAFDDDPVAFRSRFASESQALSERVVAARDRWKSVAIEDAELRRMAELLSKLGIDGHRGELGLARAARAHAALRGGRKVQYEDLQVTAALALRHRLRQDPLETRDLEHRITEGLRGGETT